MLTHKQIVINLSQKPVTVGRSHRGRAHSARVIYSKNFDHNVIRKFQNLDKNVIRQEFQRHMPCTRDMGLNMLVE